jgi:thiol-disulfide isomerase/thioredoxin
MFRKTILAASVALACATAVRAGDEPPFKLMVGDPAPALNVGAWVKGDPVTSFQRGTTYVVEFWATWCKPCREAMPHLSELQQKFADKNVRFIGVSIWERDQSLVEPFVEKMGDKMAYTVAMDRVGDPEKDHGWMADNWMAAAGQNGIPASFIVRDGVVAWIGDPRTIEDTLEKVAAGQWDVQKARAQQVKDMARQAVMMRLQTRLQQSLSQERYDDALAALDDAFQADPELEGMAGQFKFLCLLKESRPDASTYGRKLVEGAGKDNPQLLNAVAWMIVDPKNETPQRDLELAVSASKRAADLTEWKNPAVLDTHGLALFLSGKVDQAIDVQEKAVKLAVGTQMEQDLKNRLEEFRKKAGTQG